MRLWNFTDVTWAFLSKSDFEMEIKVPGLRANVIQHLLSVRNH